MSWQTVFAITNIIALAGWFVVRESRARHDASHGARNG